MIYKIVKNNTDPDRWNCVKYVRTRISNLPWGLWTIGQKRAIIDTQNPKKGRVAVIKTSAPWGHLAIVKDYDEQSKKITIEEANFDFGKITERTGNRSELKIEGFFNPEKKRWQD